MEIKLTEAELLDRVANGDRQSFQQLYEMFAGELHKYIYLFTRSREDTEEILQDVFVKLWQKRQTLLTISSFRGYLYRMARNHVLNYFRAAKAKIKTDILQEEDQHSSGTGAADHLLYKQYYKIAQHAIDCLPKRRKEVFNLSLNEDLSIREIAVRLNISKSAVKQHLYAASAFIREYLQKHGNITPLLFIFLSLFDQ